MLVKFTKKGYNLPYAILNYDEVVYFKKLPWLPFVGRRGKVIFKSGKETILDSQEATITLDLINKLKF